ncbi:hypothetical protein [Capnocytophaga stomatis]|nr:hypothetical protein [Capnocytophaga stomatis]
MIPYLPHNEEQFGISLLFRKESLQPLSDLKTKLQKGSYYLMTVGSTQLITLRNILLLL